MRYLRRMSAWQTFGGVIAAAVHGGAGRSAVRRGFTYLEPVVWCGHVRRLVSSVVGCPFLRESLESYTRYFCHADGALQAQAKALLRRSDGVTRRGA